MPDEIDDADDDVFSFGGHDDRPEDADRRRRTKRVALWALAVVLVVVALSITLVSQLVDTSGGPPRSPSAAARQWARDLVRGDTSGRTALECPGGSPDGTALAQLVTAAAADARAGHARTHGTDAWRVPVAFLGPGGGTEASITVDVVKHAGRYLVC